MRVRSILAALMLGTLLMAACMQQIPKTAPAQAAAAAPTSSAVVIALPPVIETRQCKRIDRAWLKRQAPAEGSVVIAFEVSKARRRQVQQQNEQLASIEAALMKHGCVELP